LRDLIVGREITAREQLAEVQTIFGHGAPA
jgi:hypothetical protein